MRHFLSRKSQQIYGEAESNASLFAIAEAQPFIWRMPNYAEAECRLRPPTDDIRAGVILDIFYCRNLWIYASINYAFLDTKFFIQVIRKYQA